MGESQVDEFCGLRQIAVTWTSWVMLRNIHPVLSRFISTWLFSVLQVENEVKRTSLCGCCWDPRRCNWRIKEGLKRGIFGSFSETVRPSKSLYIRQLNLFWTKKGTCLPHVSSIFKKSVLKLLDRSVYISHRKKVKQSHYRSAVAQRVPGS